MKLSSNKCPFNFNKARAKIDTYDNDRYLISFSEVGKDYGQPHLDLYSKQILRVRNYIYSFISQENDQLGRDGIVCPYTPGALKRNNLFFTVCNQNLSNRKKSKELVLDYMNLFLKLEPTVGKYRDFKSIVILLPEVSDEFSEEVIEKVQNELKPFFVKKGLMIGQFYPKCTSQGVHNKNFRPLQSPIPWLVIRYMVKTDYVFLDYYEQEYFQRQF